MKERDRSIRTKLIKLILTISSLSLFIAFIILFTYEILSFRLSTQDQLQVLGAMLAQNSTAALAFDDTEDAAQVLSSLSAEKNVLIAILFNDRDEVFASYVSPLNESIVPVSRVMDGLISNNNYFELTLPVIQNQKRLGTLFMRRSTADMHQKLMLYTMILLAVLAFCFVLTYFVSRRLGKSISGPIISLATTAKFISDKQDYSVRAKQVGEGELKTLTEAFNLMLSRIESQNREIQRHAQVLESKVLERTLEIKRQKDFAETIINSSLVLIAVFDAEARFIGFNKRCEIEFGRKAEDVMGKRFAEAMPSVVGSPAYKAVIRALNGENTHYECYESPVSGEYYEAFSVPLRNERDEVYAALLTAHNITSTVKTNEKLLTTNDELKKKNAELEQFAYVASHDLQEPLRKIKMFADRAKQIQTDRENAAKYLQKIETSAERMSKLIHDVLEYSKISKVEESFIQTDLNLIIEYVKSDFELLIMEKNVRIETGQLPIILGHPLQLHQLFANLINNSIKFCERIPHITIFSQPASLEEIKNYNLDAKREYCKLIFSDNGIGFDPAYKDKVFTIFQRLNTREKYEGTGIGLALCKKIVENHGGNISVDSEVNEGTRFTIILPMR